MNSVSNATDILRRGATVIDMSPTQPHTITKNARTCESNHATSKAIGLGISSTRPWDEQHYVDLEAVEGTMPSERARLQMESIVGLDHDWSQIVDEEGNQLATVGHHFQLSRDFSAVRPHSSLGYRAPAPEAIAAGWR